MKSINVKKIKTIHFYRSDSYINSFQRNSRREMRLNMAVLKPRQSIRLGNSSYKIRMKTRKFVSEKIANK